MLQLSGEARGQRVRLALASALPHLSVPVRSLVAQHLLRFDQAMRGLPVLALDGGRVDLVRANEAHL